MTILGSRLRVGAEQWDTAAEIFKAPDRNMTGSALFNDGKGKLFFFNGLETDAMWRNLALVMRTSTDNGATWSKPEFINPNHGAGNQAISGTSLTPDGILLQPCDAVSGGSGGKDPVYTDEIYLKKPERVKVLGYLFLFALTIYRVFQRRVRQHITEQKQMRGAGGRILRHPTAAAIFQIFKYQRLVVLRLPDGTRLRQQIGDFSKEEKRVLASLGLDESVYLN